MGVFCGDTITVQDSGEIIADGGDGNGTTGVSRGIETLGSSAEWGTLTVKDSSKITATGGKSINNDSHGMEINGNISISGGVVIATGGIAPSGCGISGGSNIYVTGGLVKATGETNAVLATANLEAPDNTITGCADYNTWMEMTEAHIDGSNPGSIYMGDSGTDTMALTAVIAAFVETPIISPNGGTFASAQCVTLSCTTTGATIRYTTDGSEPTASSTQYSAAFTVSSSCTVKAKAFNTSITDSATATATFTIDNTSPVPSNPTITEPTVSKIVTVLVGDTATLAVTASDVTGYQWWVNRGGGWEVVSGATGASYTTSPVTMANNGYQYNCVVSGASGTTLVTSPLFTLNVIEQPDIPKTGDNSMSRLWFCMLLMAAGGLAVNVLLGRRKRHS